MPKIFNYFSDTIFLCVFLSSLLFGLLYDTDFTFAAMRSQNFLIDNDSISGGELGDSIDVFRSVSQSNQKSLPTSIVDVISENKLIIILILLVFISLIFMFFKKFHWEKRDKNTKQ